MATADLIILFSFSSIPVFIFLSSLKQRLFLVLAVSPMRIGVAMVMHYLYYTVNLDLLLAHAAIISPLPANVRDDKFHVTPVPLGLVKGRF